MNFIVVNVAKEPPVDLKGLYGEKDIPLRVIDKSACEPFGLNAYGHPRSEISFLRENAQSALQEAIAKQLIYEKTHGSNLSDGLTSEQMFDNIRARYLQTASEQEAYIQQTGALADSIAAKQKGKELLNESVVESAVEPAVESVANE